MFFRISWFPFITGDSDTSLEYPTTCHETLTVDIVAAGNMYRVLESRHGMSKHRTQQTLMKMSIIMLFIIHAIKQGC